MKNKVLMVVTFALLMISCDEETDKSKKLRFEVSGAKAILYGQNDNPGGRIASSELEILKIDEEGRVTSIVEGINIIFIKTFSDGLFVETDDGRKFYVRLDNTYKEISDVVGPYKGENLNGDLIFDNATILRKSTLEVEKIQTTLTSPRIQSVSGNFAILTDFSVYQILNTVSGIRFNISDCNGPRMIALNETIALVDDCQHKMLMDMITGDRNEADVLMFNHEGVTTNEGVVVLSQSFPSTPTDGFYLGLIDSEGIATLLSTHEFQPGSSSCMNCGISNHVLFNSGDYFIVREQDKVTVIQSGNPVPKTILDGYNITSISVDDNLVYYLAEDNLGSPVTGVYNLLTDENEVITVSSYFDVIQTFN